MSDFEPWETVWTAFVWGGLSGIFLAMILNTIGTVFILGILYGTSSESDLETTAIIVGAVIVAPIVEEFVKPLVMLRNTDVKKEIDEVEDAKKEGNWLLFWNAKLDISDTQMFVLDSHGNGIAMN